MILICSLSLSLAIKRELNTEGDDSGYSSKKRQAVEVDLSSNLKLSDIQSLRDKGRVSLVVIIKQCGRLMRTSKDKPFCFIRICDDSLFEGTFAIWGVEAEHFNIKVGETLAISNALLKTFNSMKQLSYVNETVMFQDSISERSKVLQQWWKDNKRAHFRKLFGNVETTSIEDVQAYAVEGKMFTFIQGHVKFTHDSISYLACLKCNKKVIKDAERDMLWCKTCQESPVDLRRKYFVHGIRFIDNSGDAYMIAFDAVCEELFGMNVTELEVLQVFFLPFSSPFFYEDLLFIDIFFFFRFQKYMNMRKFLKTLKSSSIHSDVQLSTKNMRGNGILGCRYRI